MPRRLLLAPALAALLCACASGASGDRPAATVRLLPPRSPGAQGSLDLVQVGEVLRIAGTVHGLRTNARYRLQIADADACASPQAPAGAAGDPLPDLHADATGAATFGFDLRTRSLGGPADVLGRAVVLRPRPGDPSAGAETASGGWLACGIVRPR